jgi:decaprenyl-phosphate phosphoribosyltransferase
MNTILRLIGIRHAVRDYIIASMIAIVRLLRLRQWVKNLFIFVPAFFAGSLFDFEQFKLLIVGALAFSCLASGIYVLNDYQDRSLDRLHPRKKFRPLASGEVSLGTAWALIIVMIGVGLTIAILLNTIFFYLLVGYLVLNLAYSFGLKNTPIVDMFIVATGFLLRVYSGGAIAGLEITHWLSIMILLLALFLIIAKRRDDILIQTETGAIIRKSSQSYNLEYINSCLTLISGVTIVAYIMYTVSPEVTERFDSDYLFITTIFVIAGIMRYLQITFVEKKSGSPSRMLVKDKFMLLTVVCWVISFYIIIYIT